MRQRSFHGRASQGQRENQAEMVYRRPGFHPDRFDGSTPWRDYKAHFESCALINRWTSVQKAQFLAASLRGPAQEVLADLEKGTLRNYDSLQKRLEQRFGPGEQAEAFLTELRARTRNPGRKPTRIRAGYQAADSISLPRIKEGSPRAAGKGALQRRYLGVRNPGGHISSSPQDLRRSHQGSTRDGGLPKCREAETRREKTGNQIFAENPR